MKERIYITDITLHTRMFQQTVNFSKVAHKGRMYSPLPNNIPHNAEKSEEKGSFKIAITLPKDLQERISRGEVEVMIPEGGIDVRAGFDIADFLQSTSGKRFLRGLAKKDQ